MGTNGTNRRKAGRPKGTDLSKGKIPPEDLEQFYAFLEEMPVRTAVASGCLSWGTFTTYLKRGGEEDEGPHREFLIRTTRARAKFKAKLECLAMAKRPEWMLAMLYPRQYSLKQHVETNLTVTVAEALASLRPERRHAALDRN